MNADTVFNGYVAANVLYALDTLGMLDALESGFEVGQWCQSECLDIAVVDALLTAAEDIGHVARRGAYARLTEVGVEAREVIGFMVWGVGGYHDIFAAGADIARGRRRFRHDVHRDEGEVARGSALAGRSLMKTILDEVMANISFETLADLGSGTCDRLCGFVGQRPGTKGIGLDISAAATHSAVDSVHGRGLGDRVTPLQADVLDVIFSGAHRELCAEADVVMSFMFLHDLLAPVKTRQQVIPALREAFPNAHTFLIADTTIRPRAAQQSTVPVFSTGFELAHALMGVPLYTREEYSEFFVAGGLEIKEVFDFGAPYTYLYALEAH